MKNLLKTAAILLFLPCLAFAYDIYVSPDGSDINTGTKDRPTASVERALERAQKLIELRGYPAEGINVIVEPGEYGFAETLAFGEGLSGLPEHPLTIKCADGKAFFNGGIALDTAGGKIAENEPMLSSRARGNVYVVEINDGRLISLLSNRSVRLSQQGRMMTLAKYPNIGYAHIEKIIDAGAVYAHGRTKGDPPKYSMDEPIGGVFTVRNKDVSAWEKEFEKFKKAYVVGYLSNDWYKENHRIASISDGRIKLVDYSRYGLGVKKEIPRRFIINDLLSELDSPGEFFFDENANKLYFWPFNQGSISGLSIWAGESFAEFKKSSNVRVENIVIEGVSQGKSVINITDSENIELAGCVIRNCSRPAVMIEGGSHCGIRSCDIYDVPYHLKLSGGNVKELKPSGNYAENCHFTQVQASDYYGKIQISGVGQVFRNNLVHNFIGQVMTVGDNDHLIEYNEFFNIGIEEGDGGTMYSGAAMWSWGNVYQRNFLHHLMCLPQAHPRGGIYPDDRDQGDTIRQNLFYKAAHRAVLINGGAGHKVNENIFLKGYIGIYNTEAGSQKMYDMQSEYNSGKLKRGDKMDYIWRTEQVIGEEGWNKEPWISRYPLFAKIMNQPKMRFWPIECDFSGNYFHGNAENIQYRFGYGRNDTKDISEVEYIDARNNREISLDIFKDADSLDFNYAAERIAQRMPDIQFERIGLYQDQYRKDVPDKKLYRKLLADKFRDRKSYDPDARYDPDTISDMIYFNTGKLLAEMTCGNLTQENGRIEPDTQSYKVSKEDYDYAMDIYNTPEPELIFPNPHPGAQWFTEAGLGLFMHWGIHSVKALQPSWSMIRDYRFAHYPEDEDPNKYIGFNYYHLAEKFDPQSYDPDMWFKAAADAGFKYAVLTTKHHDGYALWPSKYGNMSTRTYMGGRDLINEYVEACRKNGLKVGFYFSQRDWHYPNFPVLDVGFDNKRRGEEYQMSEDEARKLFQDFYAYTINQLRELLTNYGTVDVLWFDGLGSWPGLKEKRGDTKVLQTYQWIRSLQPGIVINDRWDKRIGDMSTPEGHVPEDKIEGWWESCISIKGHWGYSPHRDMWSIEKFCDTYNEIREKGGNFLANVGPAPDGTMPDEFYELCKKLNEGECEE